MKYSQFNTIVPYDGQFALYNSFNQKVIFIEEDLKNLLDASKIEGIDNLINYHPTFYEYLVSENFVIENDINEVEEVKKLSKAIDENLDNYFLTINPTMNCNFKCWYCYETHEPQSKLGLTMIKKINQFIDKKISDTNIKMFNLSFFGGEPLLYFTKDVAPIIDNYLLRCNEKNITPQIGFTTNGYLINENFINYFQSKGINCFLQITLDGYKEKHDSVRFVNEKRGSYEEIINNIILLVNNKFNVRVRVNYTSENIEDTHKIANEFKEISQELKDNYLAFDFHRVWQDNKLDETGDIAKSNIDLIREIGIEAKSGTSADNVRNSCYADKRNSSVINYNGDIYKCTARDFKKEDREGYLTDEGDIFWENDNLEKRMNIKFKNKPCLTCKILPLCNGGCTQHALDNEGTEFCVYFGDENEKDKIVKAKIEEILDVL